MNQESFEARVLEMWMRTRIPLTRANLQFYTHAPRKKVDRWLDGLVADGVLEVDADDEGEMFWTVRGAVRPATGPTTVAEMEKLAHLRSEAGVGLAPTARGLMRMAEAKLGGPSHLPGGRQPKSLLASGALSFLFGPIGWIYAAPLGEAIPAIVIFIVLAKLLPMFLLFPLFPLSAIAGLAYAYRYNQRGERTGLSDDVKRLTSRK